MWSDFLQGGSQFQRSCSERRDGEAAHCFLSLIREAGTEFPSVGSLLKYLEQPRLIRTEAEAGNSIQVSHLGTET